MSTTLYRKQIIAEINDLPDEYLLFFINILHNFRETLLPASAELSLKQGLLEALHGQTYPIDELWDDLDVE